MSNVLPPSSPLLLCTTLLNFMESAALAMDTCAQSCAALADKSTEYLQSHPEEVQNALLAMAVLLQRGTIDLQNTVIEGRQTVASALPTPTGKRMA